jgi:hypothetical protein
MERRSGKLTIGAFLCIAAGIMTVILGGFYLAGGAVGAIGTAGASRSMLILWGIIFISLGLIAILGGRYALKRKQFALAIMGGAAAAITLTWPGIALGIPAIILIALSRKEFR